MQYLCVVCVCRCLPEHSLCIFFIKVMLNWNEGVYLWPQRENSTEIMILQRSTGKPVQKFCNDMGQRKQQVDSFSLGSHALGLVLAQGSWQQSPRLCLHAASRHPTRDGGTCVFTSTSTPCYPMWRSHAHKSQSKHIHWLTNQHGLSACLL